MEAEAAGFCWLRFRSPNFYWFRSRAGMSNTWPSRVCVALFYRVQVYCFESNFFL